MIIDAHAHIGRFNLWPLAPDTVEQLLTILRAESIDYALVSSAKAICYDCPSGNADVLEAAAAHDQILPLLCVNPVRREESSAELSTWRTRGFIGVKLHPTQHAYSLVSPAADAVLDFCEENAIPVLTHADEDDPRCDPAAMATVAARHPDLTLIVGHACLFSSRGVVDVAEEYPNLYLELSVNYEAGKLEDTVRRLGCERLLFGSDVPLHNPSVMLQRIKVVGLPQEDENKILCENARHIYGLKLPVRTP